MRSKLEVTVVISYVFILLIGMLGVILALTFVFPAPDWYSFIVSGRLFSAGLNPYVAYPAVGHLAADIHGYMFDDIRVNANPPILLPLFSYLGRFDASASLILIKVITFLCVLFSIYHYKVDHKYSYVAGVLIISSFAMAQTIDLGQIYCLLLLLVMMVLPRQPFMQGVRRFKAAVALGLLVAIKPNFGLLIVLLFAGGEFVISLVAVVIFLFATAISTAAIGVLNLRSWAEAIHTLSPSVSYRLDLTAFLFPLPGIAVFFLSISIALATVWAVWKIRPSYHDTVSLGIMLSLLLSPLGWVGYSLCLIPSAFQSFQFREYWLPAIVLCANTRLLGIILHMTNTNLLEVLVLRGNALGLVALIAVHIRRMVLERSNGLAGLRPVDGRS